MSTVTTHFGFPKPDVNNPIDANQWGYQLNGGADKNDGLHYRWLTNDIGSSRPTDAAAGTLWINNSANPWTVYIFDGTNDVAIGTLDTTTNEFNPSNTSNLTQLILNADTTFSFNGSAVPVPDLTFTLQANKKYKIEINGSFAPNATWGGGSTNVINWYTDTFTFSGGAIKKLFTESNSTSGTIIPTISPVFNSTPTGGTFNILTNQIVGNTNTTVVNVMYERIVLCGPSDQVFSTNLLWSGPSPSFTGTAVLKAGSNITYQEIN